MAHGAVFRRVLRWVVFLAAGVLMSLSPAWAQQSGGSTQTSNCNGRAAASTHSVGGVVQDPSGAVMSGVSVSLICGATTKTAVTDASGQFQIPSLAPGHYEIKIDAKGFAPFSQGVTVAQGIDTSHQEFRLAIAPGSTSVSVTDTSGYVAPLSTTGTKTDTPLIETPESISVVTRQQMDDQQPQSLNEAVRYTPGIVPESNGVSSNFWSGGSLMLRGFIPEVYQDSLEDDSSGNDLLDSYFYQRVEVVGGPDSVLYGQASPGGLVDVETKRPPDTPIHEVQIGFGSYGRYEGQFDLGGPIDANDHFSYRLTAVGFTENTQTEFVNEQRLAIAPAFTWKPNANTSLTFLANYTYNPAIGQYAYVPAVGTVLPNPNGKISSSFYVGDPNFNKTEQQSVQAGYQFEHRFGSGWTFDQNLRYTTNSNHANMIWPLDLEPDLETLDRYSWIRNATFNSIITDTRIRKEFATGPVRHVLLGGFNYQHYYENWLWGENDDIPPINVFNPVYYQDIAPPTPDEYQTDINQANQLGVYAQDQISLNHWRFVLGGREDWVNYSYTNGGPYTQDDKKFTWRAGAVYLFNNGLAPYFSYSTSYQPDIGVTASGSALPPTSGQQYEAGIKYQKPGSRNLVTAAVYNLAQQNVGVMDPNNPNFDISIGEITSRGVELQDHASITRSLDLIATYTFTDSRYTKTTETDTGIDGVTTSTQGKYQYGVPPQMASLWANYTLHSGPVNGFGFGGGVRYVGFSYGDDVNSFKVPGFTLVDAGLHYDFSETNRFLKRYRLQVNATNLFDKSYIASCFSSSGCYFGLRRQVYGTIRYAW